MKSDQSGLPLWLPIKHTGKQRMKRGNCEIKNVVVSIQIRRPMIVMFRCPGGVTCL